MKKRRKTALEQVQVHGDELKSFTEARGDITQDWRKMILDWESDQEKPEAERVGALNPYDLPKGGKFSNYNQCMEGSESDALRYVRK